MVDLDFYRRRSGEVGLPLQFVMKEFRVMDILAQVASNKELNIIFKGGTAINRIYLTGLSRFSEDLDFDEISKDSKITRIKNLQNLTRQIKGYEISKPWKLRWTIRFDCFYINELNQKDNVRLEFNLKSKVPVCEKAPELRTVDSEVSGKTITGVRVYSLEDLLARKLYTMYARTEGKDLYDTYQLFEKSDKKTIKNALGKILKFEKFKHPENFLEKLESKLEDIDIKRIKSLTNNYIPVPLRPNWNELVSTLIQNIKTIG